MKISMLLEERKLLAVVYGGRFQPFHKGHYAVYRELCKTFGEGSVWIATSNKTNLDPGEGDVSPFNFEEKLEMMVQLFGISPEKVIKCKNPAFAPKEVLELYKAPTVCVMVAGDKDVERYSKSKMYKPYPIKQGDTPVPFPQAMNRLQTMTGDPAQFYYVVSNARDGSQSGTSIRAAFQAAGDDQGKQERAFKKFYGKVDDDILDLMVSKIRLIKPPPPPKKEKAEPPVKSKAKELPEPKLDKESSLSEATPFTKIAFPSLSQRKLITRKDLLGLQTQLIDLLPDRFDVGLDEHGVTVQEPKTPSRSGKKLWVIPNTFDESLYYGELDMKGFTYSGPRRNALLQLVKFMTLDITR